MYTYILANGIFICTKGSFIISNNHDNQYSFLYVRVYVCVSVYVCVKNIKSILLELILFRCFQVNVKAMERLKIRALEQFQGD